MGAAHNDKIKKFADMAYASAQAKINSEYEIKIANMREDLGKRGLSSSSVMDREMARLHAERVMALVRANANALMQGYELYGTLDEEAAQEIIRDVTQLHGTVTTAIDGTAEWETAMRMRRTGENDPGAAARASQFARQVDRLSTPVLNEIACEIERRRLMPKEKSEHGTITNVYHVYGHNPRWNVQSTDQSINAVTVTSEQLFVKLRHQIKQSPVAPEEQSAILARLGALEQAQNTPSFAQKYAEFIGVAANHMQLIAPFIPALTEMLQKALT